MRKRKPQLREVGIELLEAAQAGKFDKVKSLHLEKGADIHAHDYGMGALTEAAKRGNNEVINYIMQTKFFDPELTIKDMANWALNAAIYSGQIASAELLVKHYKAPAQFEEFRIAAEKGYIELYRTMIEVNREVVNKEKQNKLEHYLLIEAMDRNEEDLIRLLLNDLKVKVDVETFQDYINKITPEIIKLILDYGFDINSRLTKEDFFPALDHKYNIIHKVLSSNKLIELAEYVISKGADVNSQDSDKNTPLHILMKNAKINIDKRLELTKLLVEKGANVNIQNNKGDTPLHILVECKEISYPEKKKVAEFLIIDCNADVDIFNKLESTPYSMVCDSPLSKDIIEASLIVLERELEEEEKLKELQDNAQKAKSTEKLGIDKNKENIAKITEEVSGRTTFVDQVEARSIERRSPKGYTTQPLKQSLTQLQNNSKVSFKEKEIQKRETFTKQEAICNTK